MIPFTGSIFSIHFPSGDRAVVRLCDGRMVTLPGGVGRLLEWIAALDGLVLARRPGVVLMRWPNGYAADLLNGERVTNINAEE